MMQKLDYQRIAPDAEAALHPLEKYIKHSGLDPMLVELVKFRAAQINACPACLDTHSRRLVEKGESPQRLYALSAWRKTDYFSERERAALAWTEVLTRISRASVPQKDQAFEALKAHFTEKEIVDLTMTVIAINSWNRLHTAFGVVPSLIKIPAETRVA